MTFVLIGILTREFGTPFWCWLFATLAMVYARVLLEKWRVFLAKHLEPELATNENTTMEPFL